MSIRRSLLPIFSTIVILSLLFSGLSLPSAYAQGKDGLKRQVNAQTGKVSFLGPDGRQVMSASKALGTSVRPQNPAMALAQRFGPEFGVKNPARELQEIKNKRADNGRIMARYQQKYDGIPVMGGELIVNTNDNGDLYSMNGEVSQDLSLSTQPAIDATQAIDTALQAVAKWYKKTTADFQATDPELWIYDESLLHPSDRPAELVWRMEVKATGLGLPVRELVLVNAQRGTISLHFNQIDTAWSSSKKTDPAQDTLPTPTPEPVETQLPVETAEAIATKPPVKEESSATKVAPVPAVSSGEMSAQSGIILYVATTGNDANTCLDADHPCKTINGAIGKASDGDTIYVAVGFYQASTTILNVTKSLTILGGWASNFSSQSGYSILDGQGQAYPLIKIMKNTVAERLIFQNARNPLSITEGSGACYLQISLTLRQVTIMGMTESIMNCGILSLENTTITNNKGGFGTILNSGTLMIQNSTIVNNFGTVGQIPGGIYNSGGSVSIQNSIIYGNTSPDGYQWDCSGVINSMGHNILGTTRNCTVNVQASDQIGIDPKLGPFLPNGYFPLFSNSPAIDAGVSCPSVDQRGVSRPQRSGCDIGSYEYAVPGSLASLVIVSGNGQRAAPNLEFSQPITVAALDNIDNLVPNIDVAFTAPSTEASGTFADTGTFVTAAKTGSNGLVTTSIFTANSVLGSYPLSASAIGAGTVDFSLENFALYVTPTGDDSNSCLTSSSPCATIQAAINKASAGDTILATTGTYTSTSVAVLRISTGVKLFGGWDNTYTTQSGLSTIDAQGSRQGITRETKLDIFLDHLIITNGAYYDGAGIDNPGSNTNLTISNSSIVNNSNPWDGGGIYNYGNLTLVNTTISNNSASSGGGIYNGGNVILLNSTISNNSGFYGGGIYNAGKLTLNNATVSNNSSPNQAGGIYNNQFGQVSLQNSVVAGNIASSPIGLDCYGTISSSGHNLIGTNSGCTFSVAAGDKVGTSASPINPRLAPLQDYGGPNFTQALLSGSPAIDAGDPVTCLAKDQRGVARPAGVSCDIGAYEGSIQWLPAYRLSTYTAGRTASLPGTLLCNQTDPMCSPGDIHARMAHKYTIGTYELYATHFNRNSLDNNGMTIISTVHFCDAYDGCPYSNATWNGEQIVYGDGYDYPLADDVVAHEYTHGVTQYESNLFYYYQSGAINESLSDIWGEYYDQTNGLGKDGSSDQWKIGEDSYDPNAFRSMSDPTIYNDPDKMSSGFYYEGQEDSGGVHTNSGVNNKAAYLMIQGGSFNTKNITALGWEKTTAIYYEANTHLLISGSDYSDLYYALQQACTNLIGQKGITSADCTSVKNALEAVEMNAQPATNYNSHAPQCTTAGTTPYLVFADDLEAGLGNWTFNNGNYVRWQLDTPYGPFAQSGAHSLFADDYPATVADASAKLKSFVVPANAFLHFAQAYDFETSDAYYDGGVLEYSVNNGATWTDAKALIDGGYPGTISAKYDNPLKGRWAFVGTTHGYISTRVNLASLAGKTVMFRWRMGLDTGTLAWGWWVDNIKMYTCGPSSAAADVFVAGAKQGTYSIPLKSSVRPSYAGLNNGPVKIQSNNGVPLVASERVAYTPDGGATWTSYSELMGMPVNQLTSSYTFPWYNNADLNTQLRFGNVGASFTTVTVTVGGQVMGNYPLAPNASQRVSYPDLNAGPVKVTSSSGVPIIASMRVAYTPDNTTWTSFSEMMGLPSGQLTTGYLFPWYNNADLNTQLRFGNVGSAATNVTVTVAGQIKGAYTLLPNESRRVSYPGLNAGPVKVTSSGNVPIIASMRVAYTPDNGATWPEFSEMMGMPLASLSTYYSFPVYNNVDLNTQLRFGNVGAATTTVTVTIGGVLKGSYVLAPNASQRVSYPVNGGPVVIQSTGGVPIIASERVAYFDTLISKWTSFAEWMGMPREQMTTSYLFPWYNNVDLNTQLRFGAP